MKKFQILGAALMALAMTACDNEPQVRPGSNENKGEIAGKFIGISLKNAETVGSRAENLTGPTYVEGSDDENAIKDGQLHFLFFDENGAPFTMLGTNVNDSKDSYEGSNWIKPVINAGLADNKDVITKEVEAVLILGTGTDSYEGRIPSRVICVANVDDQTIISNYENKSIAELLDYRTTAATTAPLHTQVYTEEGDKKTNFVMTSSSWWDGTNVICWSDITADNICAEAKDATLNPVDIYIERLAAKVTVSGLDAAKPVMANAKEVLTIQVNELQENGEVTLSEPKNVIAVPTGWNLNTVSSQTFGIKHLLSRKDDGLYSPYFASAADFNIGVRSFWASTSSINAVQDFKPEELIHANGETIYTLANTRDPFLYGNGTSGVDNLRYKVNFARCYATKVLVGVNFYLVPEGTTTVAADATPDSFMYWGGMYYTPEALCAVLGRGQDGHGVAYARGVDEAVGNYNVQFYLVSDPNQYGKNITGSENDSEITLMSVPTAECWSGMGYYILNISNGIKNTKATTSPARPAGTTMYGVLRNTSYEYTIDNFIGLGTPVPNTDITTRVENPEESETYVAARLNILNWRTIKSNVSLQ